MFCLRTKSIKNALGTVSKPSSNIKIDHVIHETTDRPARPEGCEYKSGAHKVHPTAKLYELEMDINAAELSCRF